MSSQIKGLRFFNDIGTWNVAEVGGKAYHLHKLTQWGFPIPRFMVLDSNAYNDFLSRKTLDPHLLTTIDNTLKSWGSKYISVRSSMSLEDGSSASFAGILESYLFVDPENVCENVLKCYEALHAPRVKVYLDNQKLGHHDLKMGVVIQEMIDSRCSGVAFSRSPHIHSGLIMVEAGLGLGEGVVSGQVEVDQYLWDRFGEEWSCQIGDKKSRVLYFPQKKAVSLVEVEDQFNKLEAMTYDQRNELVEQVKKIEIHMGRPSDIEWSLDQNGKLYILQTRAITQDFPSLRFFSDTNLSESYPGRVSPMTASFVKAMYTKVISEGLQILGCPPNLTTQLDHQLKTLIAEFDQHLYYDLESYYGMLAHFPGGESNIKAWHQMIGGHQDSNQLKISKPNLWIRSKMIFNLGLLILKHQKIYSDFMIQSKIVLDQLDLDLANSKTPDHTAQFVGQTIDKVQKWGLTVLNDFVVIVGLKGLNHFFEKYSWDPQQLPNLLKTTKGVISTEALSYLKILIAELENDNSFELLSEFITLKNQDRISDLIDFLKSKNKTASVAAIEKYLLEFGDRSFEELKLESLTFSQSAKLFLNFLIWSRKSTPKVVSQNSPEVAGIDTGKMSALDKWLFAKIKLIAQRAVHARESTRLMRGRYYGLIRRALLQLAEQCQQQIPAFSKLKREDIFCLSLNDLSNVQNIVTLESLLKQAISNHGHWNDGPKIHPEHYAHSSADPKPYFLIENKPKDQSNHDVNLLVGQGASPGTTEGRPLVVFNPQDAMAVADLDQCILVTRSTDPAWIFIMSKCRGLISEKGSLLSHSAIVGRELKIPTVVGVSRACESLKNQTWIRIDGNTGQIQCNLERNEH